MNDLTAYDLVARLRAKLDEHEQAARAATPGTWRWGHLPAPYAYGLIAASRPGERVVLPSAAKDVFPQAGDAQHIVLHDPPATLDLIAAHRTLLDSFDALHNNPERHLDPSLHLYWTLLRDVISTIARGYRITVCP